MDLNKFKEAYLQAINESCSCQHDDDKTEINEEGTMSKVLETLRQLMTYKFKEDELEEFVMYFHSPKRLCVKMPDAAGIPEAWFMDGRPNLKSTGFENVKDLADFLKQNGVRLIDKPKTIKTGKSFYD